MIITLKRKTFDNNSNDNSNNKGNNSSNNNNNNQHRNNKRRGRGNNQPNNQQNSFKTALKKWEEKDLLGVYKNGLLYGGLGLAGVAGLGTAYYLIDKANKEKRKQLGKYYIDESLDDLSNE
jgi:hypothetical protein